MGRVTLVTGHYWDTKRRAGFHWLADAYKNLGYEVLFFSAPISYMLQIKGDYRFEFNLKKEANKLIKKDENLYSYVHFTPWHVANMRSSFLNKISMPLMKLYSKYSFKDAEKFIGLSDMIIFESSPGLFLFEKIKKLNPTARFVYRVSDDLRLLNVHPALIKLEHSILDNFDLVSVPSMYIKNVLSTLILDKSKLKVQLHGINKEIFNTEHESPYKLNKNAVFVGNSHFDYSFLKIASTFFPEINFHIIGPIPAIENRPNIITYGEIPFKDTIAYIKHADIGLQIRSYSAGAESLTDSLKVLQYTFCKLPIIAPVFLKTSRQNTFYYNIGEESSIESAINAALAFNKKDFDNSEVNSWNEVAAELWK
jgi:2-beta-glucuronyltransferase